MMEEVYKAVSALMASKKALSLTTDGLLLSPSPLLSERLAHVSQPFFLSGKRTKIED
ncbi:MAG: hypothetical protein IK011_03710 [Bacteroidaceae bacterium]|nr:hypothetical protein [Bacteroidaceae bacterium]